MTPRRTWSLQEQDEKLIEIETLKEALRELADAAEAAVNFGGTPPSCTGWVRDKVQVARELTQEMP